MQSTIYQGVSYPRALAFDSSANLYVVNNGNNTVTVYLPGGVYVQRTISTDVSKPVGLAFGP